MGEREDRRGGEGSTEEAAQIKSRRRVQDLAEVYTHQREVGAMLDLVPDMFPTAADPANTDRRFLEPACGHGNFLVEILRRKLRFVTVADYGRGERLEHRVLRCLASIYGIDVSADNVGEARGRMRAVIAEHRAQLGLAEATAGFDGAVEAILATNLVHADTLADAAEIVLVEYEPGGGGTFVREWSRPLDPAAEDLNLFAPQVVRDDVAVHYSRLASQARPVRADPVEQEAA